LAAVSSSLPGSVEVGVFVLGMHRSGTSAVTRLIGFLGARTPPEEDLVQASDKNPKGYWESESLVNFNERVLSAVGSDIACPVALDPGWENDSRLDRLRRDAAPAFRQVFPTPPWVWKDPRHCLAFAFWRSVLPMKPVVVLVNRNPLEIVASSQRARGEVGKIYSLALWERYLRQALSQITGVPVLVTNYGEVLSDPLAWCERAQGFLTSAGVSAHAHRASDVLAFIDTQLRHTELTRADFLDDGDVSDAQRALFVALEQLEGSQHDFSAPVLPDETPTTEALLAERRRALQVKRYLEQMLENERRSRFAWRIRSSRYAAQARPLYAGGRRLLRALQGR
jgi:hypothetical protein